MARTITIDDLQRMMDRGDHFRLIEVEDAGEYAAGHLPGAVHLPPERIRSDADEVLPSTRDRIVLYCSGEECETSGEAARILDEMGYGEVFHMAAGKRAWRAAGKPLETS